MRAFQIHSLVVSFTFRCKAIKGIGTVCSLLISIFAMEVHDRAYILIFGVIGGPSFQDIFVKLDYGFCKGVCDNLEEIWRFRSSSCLLIVIGEVVHHLGGDILQVSSRGQTGHNLNHNQDYHSQPVEQVMDCGCRKGSFKLSSKRIEIFESDISTQ